MTGFLSRHRHLCRSVAPHRFPAKAMSDPPHLSERLFNNADSFGHAFDQAWHGHGGEGPPGSPAREEKLALILARIADHPFALSDPAMARQVAEFRIRLLGL